ncbi:hypothetical protein MRX96_052488 [Rhipicephalus microplus]
MVAATAPTNALSLQNTEPLSHDRTAPARPIGASERNSPARAAPDHVVLRHCRLDNSATTQALAMEVTVDSRVRAVQETVAKSGDLSGGLATTDITASASGHVTSAESTAAVPVAMTTYISMTAIGENSPVDPAEKVTRQAPCLNRAITGTTEPFMVSVCSTAVPSPVTLTDGEAVAIVAPDNVGTAADARRRLYVSVAVTYLAALSCGLSMAYSSPALPGIRKVMEFSDGDSDCFGSLVTLGAVIGGVSGGKRGIVTTSIFTFSDCFH